MYHEIKIDLYILIIDLPINLCVYLYASKIDILLEKNIESNKL